MVRVIARTYEEPCAASVPLGSLQHVDMNIFCQRANNIDSVLDTSERSSVVGNDRQSLTNSSEWLEEHNVEKPRNGGVRCC